MAILAPSFHYTATYQNINTIFYEMENSSMDDGKVGSIKKGEKLECELIDIHSLEKGYCCLFVFANGSREVVELSSINIENEMVMLSERKPLNLYI